MTDAVEVGAYRVPTIVDEAEVALVDALFLSGPGDEHVRRAERDLERLRSASAPLERPLNDRED